MPSKKIVFLFVIIVLIATIILFRDAIFVSGQQWIFSLDNLFYHSASTIEHVKFSSDSLHTEKWISVYLPVGYSANSATRYPTVYILHGDPGDENDWIKNGNIQQTLDTLISNNSIKPLIAVLPDGTGPTIDNGQYVDSDKIDQNLEQYISVDLIKYIDSHYATIPEGKARVIGGNSTGGYGALNIGFHHPELFSSIFSLSGYIVPRSNSADQILTPANIEKNSLLPDLSNLDSKKVPNVFLYYGTNDYFDFSSDNKQLSDALTKKGANIKLLVDDGGHDWPTWTKSIEPALIFVNQYLQ